MEFPRSQKNDPRKAGKRASRIVFFGDRHRYALRAVHTRFDAVQWFVTDAAKTDPLTGLAEVIRQESTPEAAVAGLS